MQWCTVLSPRWSHLPILYELQLATSKLYLGHTWTCALTVTCIPWPVFLFQYRVRLASFSIMSKLRFCTITSLFIMNFLEWIVWPAILKHCTTQNICWKYKHVFQFFHLHTDRLDLYKVLLFLTIFKVLLLVYILKYTHKTEYLSMYTLFLITQIYNIFERVCVQYQIYLKTPTKLLQQSKRSCCWL